MAKKKKSPDPEKEKIENSAEEIENQELNRRKAIKTLLGASSLLIANSFSMPAWGQPASSTPPTNSDIPSDAEHLAEKIATNLSDTSKLQVTVTPSLSLSQTPTNTPTVTPTLTPSVTQSQTPTTTPTVTPTLTPSVTQSQTPTTTPTITPTLTPSVTQSQTPTPTVTPSVTQSQTPTVTPTVTPTLTPSVTQSQTPTPTVTPSQTPTTTPTITPTLTPSVTQSQTPTPTVTQTQTPSQTPTITPSPSSPPLPIELSEFRAIEEGGIVKLFWKTESERSNKGFDIQRSTNSYIFDTIGWIDGAGDSNRPISYGFEDRAIEMNKTYYYRLKQIDFDTKFEYSKLVSINTTEKDKVIVRDISPTIIKGGYLTIEVLSSGTHKIEIFIYNIKGQLVSRKKSTITKGENLIRIDINNAAAGVHVVNVSIGNAEIQTKRFVVNR